MSQTRRLAAILAADVAGYSRLMGEDGYLHQSPAGLGGKRHPERQGEIGLNSILTRGSSRKLAYPKVDRPFTPIPASAVLQA
jgi:hypothetical protein